MSERILFQAFHILGDAVQLLGDGDALGAVRQALAAGDAMIGLADGGNSPVVAYQIGLFELGVVLLLPALGVGAVRDGLVVVLEGAGDVYAQGQGMQYLQSVQFTSGYSIIWVAIRSRKSISSADKGWKWPKVWILSFSGSMDVMPERTQSTRG